MICQRNIEKDKTWLFASRSLLRKYPRELKNRKYLTSLSKALNHDPLGTECFSASFQAYRYVQLTLMLHKGLYDLNSFCSNCPKIVTY